jgi:hypothetical protein
VSRPQTSCVYPFERKLFEVLASSEVGEKQISYKHCSFRERRYHLAVDRRSRDLRYEQSLHLLLWKGNVRYDFYAPDQMSAYASHTRSRPIQHPGLYANV